MLVVVSALMFSSAGLFAKGIDAGAWDIIFWRIGNGGLYLSF